MEIIFLLVYTIPVLLRFVQLPKTPLKRMKRKLIFGKMALLPHNLTMYLWYNKSRIFTRI